MKHKDRWDLPKGHVDEGETDLQTAFRELYEETGIEESEVEHDSSFRFEIKYEVNAKRYSGEKKTTITKTVRIFLGYVETEKKIKLTEHPDSAWIEWNPPHQIQKKTIDPLLVTLAGHLSGEKKRS